jgi:hypothetical protein
MRSKYKKLNMRDFWRGLIFSIGPVFLAELYKALNTGTIPDTWAAWEPICSYSLAALVLYLSVNFFQNSKGKFKKEPK